MQEKICFLIDLVEVVQNPNQKVSRKSPDGDIATGTRLGAVLRFVDWTNFPVHGFLSKYLIFCSLSEF